jgi:hypothetical protein
MICHHTSISKRDINGTWTCLAALATHGTCDKCGIRVGIHCKTRPATITPAVEIEIRAAELSDLFASHATPTESCGWKAWAESEPIPRHAPYSYTDEWLAGWLARAIAMHLDLDGEI